MTSRILIIVPTLGRRPEFLRQALHSIKEQSVPADIVVVSPDRPAVEKLDEEFEARWHKDPGKGLAAAINSGVELAHSHHEFVSWLGDDDGLEPESLAKTSAALDRQRESVLAFGSCRYVDHAGHQLWISAAGRWAVPLLRWGPQLIPQPGMLIRAAAWRAVGGLDSSFTLAFDLDLLLRLRALGTFVYVDDIVSSFRWHSDSLTVSQRSTNLRESELAKRRALAPFARRICWLWEIPVRLATRIGVWLVALRARGIVSEPER